METNLELAHLTIAEPRYAPSRAQQDARKKPAAILGRVGFLGTPRARRGAYCLADFQSSPMENAVWIVLGLCSLVVLVLSL
jgi:hypothetical protein